MLLCLTLTNSSKYGKFSRFVVNIPTIDMLFKIPSLKGLEGGMFSRIETILPFNPPLKDSKGERP